MPAAATKFQESWLEVEDKNGDLIGNWCKEGKNVNDAYCMICKCYFSISNSGISQILQHASVKKHQNAAKNLKGQQKLSWSTTNGKQNVSTSSALLTIDQIVAKAEALWAIKVATSNYSFASCKDIASLFKVMFEGHPAVDQMNMSDRKTSYIISHGLAPYFQNELVSELQASSNYFTLAFDEATTSQVRKQLDVYVRFWSEKKEEIINAYLNSVFLGHAEAEKICSVILNTLNENKLPLRRLLMLSMDGPNVNLSVAKKLNQELSIADSPDLIDFGTCSLHKIHNCFSKAIACLSIDIDEFASDLFGFFKLSAARREDLKEIQKLLDCEQRFLLRHVSSRWLTLGAVINRIILIYSSLKEYFLKFLPQDKSFSLLKQNSRYQRIVSALKDESTIVYLEFLSDLIPVLEAYLALFQKESPLIHLLYNKMNELVRNIMRRFLKETCINTCEGKDLLAIDVDNFENFRAIKDLDIGIAAKRAISKLKESNRTSIRVEFRKCLIILSKRLRETLPLSSSFLKDLETLHPLMRTNSSDNAVMRLCLKMKPLSFTDQEIDNIVREWQIYRTDNTIEQLCDQFLNVIETENCTVQYDRVDVYWAKVFKINDKFTGTPKYQKLSKLIKPCLSLSHGNADVERGFSVNNAVVSPERASLADKTIIGLRLVKDAVRRHGSILNIPITGKLLNSVKKSYSLYNEEKKKEQEAARNQAKRREKLESEQLKKKVKMEAREKLSEIEKYVKSLKDDLNTAEALLNEGNERLQIAIKHKKSYTEIKVASSMIESGTTKIKTLTEKLAEAEEKAKKSAI